MTRKTSGFGVIVEDGTDHAVLEVLARRISIAAGQKPFRVLWQGGGGCGALRKKLAAHLRTLEDRGCSHIVVVHDLDRDPLTSQLKNPQVLEALLQQKIGKRDIATIVCIPIEELEAWFWASPAALESVARGSGKKALRDPSKLPRPKNALIDLSRIHAKPRYSQNENAKLAEHLEIDLCSTRCGSFRVFREFVEGYLHQLRR